MQMSSVRIPRGWMIGLLTMWTMLGHFNRLSMAVVGNERLVRDGVLDAERMGWVYSAFLLAYTASMLPAGLLIDRWGPTAALFAMGLGFGSCMIATGLLGILNWTGTPLWLGLLFIRSLAGISSAPLHPAAARAVAIGLPASLRTAGNGIVTAGALIGIALTYPVFGALMDQLRWPGALIVSGTLLIVLALVWRYSLRGESSQVAHERPHSISAALREFLPLFRRRNLLLLSISYGAVGYFQYLFFYWIEDYFATQLKLSVADGRRATAGVMLAMAAGMAMGGGLSSWLSRIWGIANGRRFAVILGMTACSIFALYGLQVASPRQAVMWFSLSLATLGMCESVFWTTVTDLGGRTGGLAAAFLNTWGNAIGALAPILTPLIMRAYGWNAAIVGAAVFCTIGGWLWLGFDPAVASADQVSRPRSAT